MSIDKELKNGLLRYIASTDIDEVVCKKMKKCRCGEDGDYYDCMDCVEEFFSTRCIWRAENDACVNADSEHCADFVSAEQCAICRFKEI